MRTNQKKILHVIDSLKMGGAEKIVAGIVNGVKGYEHIIVTLENDRDNSPQLKIKKDIKIINLGCNSKIDYIKAIYYLHKIIKNINPCIVHSNLYWSTIVSRLSLTKESTLVSTYHSMIYDKSNKAQYAPLLLFIDRITYRKKYHSIFVSDTVSDLVTNAVGIKSNVCTIYNFVDDSFYAAIKKKYNKEGPINAISVGNYRPEKNYPCIINALSEYSSKEIVLDIYGSGDYGYLKHTIDQNNMNNVRLHNNTLNVPKKLRESDVFIMASTHEGFGVALAEAMAIGLNAVVSNIDSFKEITENNAIFFASNNPASLKDVLSKIIQCPNDFLENKKLIYSAKKYKYSVFLESISAKYKEVCE